MHVHRLGIELKELILMHSSSSPHGGDLNHDTAASSYSISPLVSELTPLLVINATLDLQEKVVAQV